MALSFLALTGATMVVLARAEGGAPAERRIDDARAAALRGADAVQSLLGALELQIQNGTANPRLMVAALDAKVDARRCAICCSPSRGGSRFAALSMASRSTAPTRRRSSLRTCPPASTREPSLARRARRAGRARRWWSPGDRSCWSPPLPSRWPAARRRRRWSRFARSTPVCSPASRSARARARGALGRAPAAGDVDLRPRPRRPGAAALAAAHALPVPAWGPSAGTRSPRAMSGERPDKVTRGGSAPAGVWASAQLPSGAWHHRSSA